MSNQTREKQKPVEGIDLMRSRRGLDRVEDLCSGPGKLTQALAIDLAFNDTDLETGPITIDRDTGYRRNAPVSILTVDANRKFVIERTG